MNEIPELKGDIAFLKKIDSRGEVWQEIGDGNKDNLCTNFLLHPKRFSSDSECSAGSNCSQRFLSKTIFKNLSFEHNNNVLRHVQPNLPQTSRTVTVEDCHVERASGDGYDNKNKTAKRGSRANFNKKFTTLVERSIKLLASIRSTIEQGIAPPDGEEDYIRRLKRLQEFTARFSRVYLYPLLRQMDELSTPDKLGSAVVNQKLMNAQQIVLQGLQAYHTHLPSSVGKCASDKLRALLDQILYMCHLHGLLKKEFEEDNNEFINALRNHAELLLEAVNLFDVKFTEKKRKASDLPKKKAKGPPNKPKSKLSMYAESQSSKKEAELKRAVEALTKKKLNVKSRYKTAGFKHRPPVDKQKLFSVPSKIKMFPKNSSGTLKSTPRKVAVREDDIKTMVEMEPELEAPPNTGEKENSIDSSQQLVPDNDQDDGSLEKALEVLGKFLGSDKRADLEKIVGEVHKTKTIELGAKKSKEPIVTITGAKNAKLICIRDDNSVVEDDFMQDKEIMTEGEIRVASTETQTDNRRPKSGVKISRLPRATRRQLKLLPKDYAIPIIQYKLRNAHFHKHDPMYRKSAQVQPWILMGQISDEIFNNILQSVAGEMEINELLENLYNAEFQY